MRYRKFKSTIISVLGLAFMIACFCAGCAKPVAIPRMPPPPPTEKKEDKYQETKTHAFRSRSTPYVTESRYEGSLWEDESSWGNLLRDHRARFRGDLVKITDLNEVITIPKKEKPPEQPARGIAAAGEAAAQKITQALEIVSGESKAEEEQNEVLSSLQSISAYVKSVLPNGNMLIVGEKVDYRQQNTVRYVTTVQGIIRPSDVDESNEVPALKLARFEAKIKRQMLAKNLRNLAPLIGTKKAGLLDRLSHMATPSASSKSTPVSTKQ